MGKKYMTTQELARQTARELRKNQTKSEQVFQQKVRNKQFLGLKILRQHPVFFRYNGESRFFIADFYCHEKRLVIEIDGGIHEKQEEYDQKRTEILENKNLKIIRFNNDEVLNRINSVLIKLKNLVQCG